MDGFRRQSRSRRLSQPTTLPMDEVKQSIAPDLVQAPVIGATIEQVIGQNPLAAEPHAPIEHPIAKKPRRRINQWLVVSGLTLVLVVGAYLWYNAQLQPANTSDHTVQRVEVKDGSSFSATASQLQERGLIKNAVVFEWFARLQGKRGDLKASTCSLMPSQSSSEILNTLTKGCHDFKSITFYPGATIEKPLYKPADSSLDQTMYIKHVLASAGYTDTEIKEALAAAYQSPVLAGKPSATTLEGYIFGETYYVNVDASAKEVIQGAIDHLSSVIIRDGLEQKFASQGLSLYQGITLASIVQRELNCEDKPTQARKDRCYGFQQTIAQIFLKRLNEGTSLGSDVTFIYAADMMGVAPTPDLDSKYNTRKYAGLPPGPIASPGGLALQAVAHPSATDYMFFIAGDDGLLYFAKTLAEHEANIRDHCQVLCSSL